MVCNTIRPSSSHTRSFFRCILNSYVYSCPFLDIQPPLIMERFISKSHFTGVLALQFGKNWTLDLLDSSPALILLLLLKGESVIFAQPIAKVVKKKVKVRVATSCAILCDPTVCYPARLFCPWNSPGTNTGMGRYSLLQGISLTQGSKLGLQHCRQILYCLSH